MGTDSKQNRWAKVLGDAGLLDDVEDAWELPSKGPVHSGAVIDVKPRESQSEESFENLMIESGVSFANKEDETREIVTVESEKRNSVKHEDDSTKKISYNKYNTPTYPPAGARISKMPFAPVNKADEPEFLAKKSSYAPPEKVDTSPAPMARHSKGFFTQDDSHQPQFAVIGLNEKLESELDSFSEHVTERISVVRVGESDISVSAYDDFESDNPQLGNIVDEPVRPVSNDPGPLSLTPQKPDLRTDMQRRYELGDFLGALEIADEVLELEPDSLDAIQYKKSCQERLLSMYLSKIGELSNTPRLKVDNHELMWRNLDSTSGFILSRVDGFSTYDNILDISGLPTFETCKILYQLIGDGLIENK
ncbi:MAG: hypothetical protein JXR91_05995 [Deltaproteobacteria bacterium]|nr:hypothetical protein [Deltaproteobacteria bacterium]